MTKAAATADLANANQLFDSGASPAFNLANGGYQRWAPSGGPVTVSIAGWPAAGRVGELMIKGINLGGASITWPSAVRWVRQDGTHSATFPAAEVALQTSGIDFIMLWTDDGGATVYGKVLR